MSSVKLTQLAHGGGCGCKIAPALLQEILGSSPVRQAFPQLLVGTENADDAAVYQINSQQAIVATTDFFMPVVDDPYTFGRIAATNALSDIYAMGATPLFALAIVGMPINLLAPEEIREILRGGESICAEAGIPIAGGHSIDAPEPIYGLVAIGIVDPQHLKRNDGARPGDVLILGKPLGVGIMSAALKKGELNEAGYQQMIESTTRLNTPGSALAKLEGVSSITDVTGFGVLGHGWEMARGAQVQIELSYAALPKLPEVERLAEAGFVTGASSRNWASYGDHVQLFAECSHSQRALLTDPQTSGGLLVSCAADAVAHVLALFAEQGFAHACVVGRVLAGDAGVSVIS